MQGFPNIELSYETLTHKKVYNSEFVLAIPDGKKYFASLLSVGFIQQQLLEIMLV
jgi:hypothetical protein